MLSLVEAKASTPRGGNLSGSEGTETRPDGCLVATCRDHRPIGTRPVVLTIRAGHHAQWFHVLTGSAHQDAPAKMMAHMKLLCLIDRNAHVLESGNLSIAETGGHCPLRATADTENRWCWPTGRAHCPAPRNMTDLGPRAPGWQPVTVRGINRSYPRQPENAEPGCRADPWSHALGDSMDRLSSAFKW